MRGIGIATALVTASVALAPADDARAQARAQQVAGGFERPVVIAMPPGDSRRLFVGEQHTGAVRIFDLESDVLLPDPFLVVSDLSRDYEQGLLGLAFHPLFAQNGLFFVNLTRTDGSTVIRRYRASASDPDQAEPNGLDLLVIPQPDTNHNGGWIGFGPDDGLLYIATGDGGGGYDSGTGHTEPGGNAQDLTDNLLGKILRIDVDRDDFPADPARNYGLPAGNPFVGRTGDDEIWAYGLRNPFRCAFDPLDGSLYCGDVGEDTREEIDYQPAGSTGGQNYGWRLREGTIATPGSVGGPAPAGAIAPIFDYPHSGADISGRVVTGGQVYRGPAAALQGLYFFADFDTSRIWSFRFDGSDPSAFDGSNVTGFTDWGAQPGFVMGGGGISSVSSFGSDSAGNLYFADLIAGAIFGIGVNSDGDGWIDPVDRCPAFASADQADADGNGIGNACECGDQNGDGTLDVGDLVAINLAIFDPARVTPLCDANNDSLCNVSDIVAVNEDLFSASHDSVCARRPQAVP